MKNIKQFQNAICKRNKLNEHVNQLVQAVKGNNDTISVMFSGILSSFLSSVVSMTLDDTIDYPWVRIVIVLAAFFIIWYILTKWIMPWFDKMKKQRRETNIEELTKQEVVSYFNSTIILTAIEIEDAINIMGDAGQDLSCRKTNAVIIVSEYVKCINYLINNVRKSHIRTYAEKDVKNVENYINQYLLAYVFEMLYGAGDKLKCYFDTFQKNENVLLIKNDLHKAIGDFDKYCKNIGMLPKI